MKTDSPKLDSLKQELHRLGLTNNPSRLEYTKRRNPEISPAATSVMYELNCSWSELLDLMGIPHKSRSIHPNWIRIDDKELLDLIFTFVRKRDIHSLKEYIQQKSETVPSQRTINSRFGNWTNVIIEYDKNFDDHRFGSKTSKAFRYTGGFDDLINSVAKYIKDNNVSTWARYNLIKPESLPSQQQLLYRSKMKSGDLTKIIRQKTSPLFANKGGYKGKKFETLREALMASSKFIMKDHIGTWKQYDLKRTKDLYSFATLAKKLGSREELSAAVYALTGVKMTIS